MARSRGARRAPAGPARVRSASPQWRGGGVAHGPKPRDYSQRTPKKMVQLALRSPRSRTAPPRSKVIVVDDWGITEPKTKTGIKLLEALGLRTKGERDAARPRSCSFRTEEDVWKSLRNLGERVQIMLPEELNTYDVLVNDWLVFSQAIARRDRRPSRRRRESRDDAVEADDDRRRRRGGDGMSEGPPRHHHQAGRVGEVVRRPTTRTSTRSSSRRTPTRSRSARRSRSCSARRSRRSHTINRKGKRKRNRTHGRVVQPRATRSGPSSPSPPARIASTSSGADGADPQAQADEPGPPLPVVLRLRRGHEDASPRSRSRSRSRRPAVATRTAA